MVQNQVRLKMNRNVDQDGKVGSKEGLIRAECVRSIRVVGKMCSMNFTSNVLRALTCARTLLKCLQTLVVLCQNPMSLYT